MSLDFFRREVLGRGAPAWTTALAVAFLVFGSSAVAPAGPLDPDNPAVADLPTQSDIPELKEAIELYRRGDTRASRDLLKKAVAAHPELPAAEIMFARMALSAGNTAEGRTALEQAIDSDPSYPDGYLILGDIAFREGRITEAGLVYAKGLELTAAYDKDPKRKKDFTIRAEAGLSAVFETRKQWQQALEHLDAWLAIDDTNSTARHHRGIALFGLGNSAEAFKEFELAYLADPKKFMPPALTIGRLYERDGNMDKAREWLRFAESKYKDDMQGRLGLAQWLWEMGDNENAHPHAWQAQQMKPDSLEAKIVLGTILRYLGEYQKAEEQLQAALAQQFGNFTAANQLALALCEQGDEEKQKRAIDLATVTANRLSDQDPRRAEAFATLAWVHYRAGKLTEADRFVRMAYNTRQVSSDMAYYMATITTESGGSKERAVQLLKDALAAPGPFAHRKEAQQLLDKLSAGEAQVSGK